MKIRLRRQLRDESNFSRLPRELTLYVANLFSNEHCRALALLVDYTASVSAFESVYDGLLDADSASVDLHRLDGD
jgi:hypothetical protein